MKLGKIMLVIALALAGCDDGEGGGDGGRDGGRRADSGPRPDGGGGDEDGGGGDEDGGPRPDGGPLPDCDDLTLPGLALEPVASGWGPHNPIALQQPDGTEDLYIATQDGKILIVRGGEILDREFLDIGEDGEDLVDPPDSDGDETGLLSFALHPNYPDDPRFYVYYTEGPEGNWTDVVGEYRRNAADPDIADTTEVRLYAEADDEFNHNGGTLAFGPDGHLYLSTGDGGGGEDGGHGPDGNALNLNHPFGKIHRFDVDADDYVPDDNPSFGGAPHVPTIWAYGLRNPWRMSFDRLTGDLYIGDVGQYTYEEVNFQPASSAGGENYGWRAYEGYSEGFPDSNDLDRVPVHAEPILDYSHDGDGRIDGESIGGLIGGAAVVGGYVYRGSAIPALRGWYLFGDYANARIAALRYCEGEARGAQEVDDITGEMGYPFRSFGEGNDGELYLLGNGVRRLVAP